MELVIWNGNLILPVSAAFIAVMGGFVACSMRSCLTKITGADGILVHATDGPSLLCRGGTSGIRLCSRGVRVTGCP